MSDEVVYHNAPKTEVYVDATTTTAEPESIETTDRGLFDYFGKKDEEKKCEEATISSEFEEKVQAEEEYAATPPPPAVVAHTEEGEQKGFMEKIKEKLLGGQKKDLCVGLL
ncbi:hypothetical protein L1887_00408 [Cichorium endivia]|nr:hypothetical protein L1887_00408 [Cichorium endivia]